MRKQHYTRAKHALMTWGRSVRMDWEPGNGLQKSSIYKTKGDFIHMEDEIVNQVKSFMRGLQETCHHKYEMCVFVYVDQKEIQDKQSKEEKLLAYHLRTVQEMLFREMCAHVVEMEEQTFSDDPKHANVRSKHYTAPVREVLI